MSPRFSRFSQPTGATAEAIAAFPKWKGGEESVIGVRGVLDDASHPPQVEVDRGLLGTGDGSGGLHHLQFPYHTEMQGG